MSRNLIILARRNHDNRTLFLSGLHDDGAPYWNNCNPMMLDKPTADRAMEMLHPANFLDPYWTFTVEKAP